MRTCGAELPLRGGAKPQTGCISGGAARAPSAGASAGRVVLAAGTGHADSFGGRLLQVLS